MQPQIGYSSLRMSFRSGQIHQEGDAGVDLSGDRWGNASLLQGHRWSRACPEGLSTQPCPIFGCFIDCPGQERSKNPCLLPVVLADFAGLLSMLVA